MNLSSDVSAFISNAPGGFVLTTESVDRPAIMFITGASSYRYDYVLQQEIGNNNTDYHVVLWGGRWPTDRISLPSPAEEKCWGVIPGSESYIVAGQGFQAARGWYYLRPAETEDIYSVALIARKRVSVGFMLKLTSS